MPHSLPELPYSYGGLAPTIDELTMRLHHARHHAAYVDDLNAALAGTGYEDEPAERLLVDLSRLPESRRSLVRDSAGGHVNHAQFWEVMSPSGGGEPTGALRHDVESSFGSVRELVRRVSEAGLQRFGSGWAWLVHDGQGLAVTSTANQDSPLSRGQRPLLGIDVWEHAYYYKHQHRRVDYIEAWWNLVDWDVVARRHAEAPAA
jgi:Fe-Mn family superoxide dismutase